ncbi:DUF6544 family protein [Pseudoruegeria sp. HB172150]|uniref:DUF6544 family protein n=1 Tax=Pseudoruegeria sp. HB172150 TaxID=2721164 RepID=UPI00155207CA|nr:DUF6544 family protein [Pseudoruegeria sp. HB172150]
MGPALIVIACLAGVPLVLMVIRTAGFAALVRGLEARLEGATPQDVSARLPQEVRDFALRSDATPSDIASRVELTQVAELQQSADDPWRLLEARQTIVTGTPGFVWEAWRDMGPLPKLRVVDSFVGGKGRLRIQLFGLFVPVDATGPDFDRGEALRYLAELPWTPDAILGNAQLRWRMTDTGWAEVSLAVSGRPATLQFRFKGGDIVEFRAENRPALNAEGKLELREWRGYFRNYRMIGTRRVPSEGEVGYVRKGSYRPYFQGRITGYDTVH